MVRALRGGVSGGTLASMMGQLEEVRASAERRRVVQDPYALSPDRAAEPDLGDEGDLGWARYDGELRMWTGPWAMAGINTRVVRRSNALQGWAYGRRFRYREVTGFGAGPAAPTSRGGQRRGEGCGGGTRRLGRPGRCSASCCPHLAAAPARRHAGRAFSASRSIPGPRPGHGTWARSRLRVTRDMPPPR